MTRIYRYVLLLLLSAVSYMACAGTVPDGYSQKVVERSVFFDLKKKTFIFADDSDGAKPAARLLRDYCKSHLHKKLIDPHSLPDKGNRIAFFGDESLPQGAYVIRMYSDMIEVRSSSPAGFDAAVEALCGQMQRKKVPLSHMEGFPLK